MKPIQQQIHYGPHPPELASKARLESAKQPCLRSTAAVSPEKVDGLGRKKRPNVVCLVATFLILAVIGVILGGVFGARALNKANHDYSESSSSSTSARPTSTPTLTSSTTDKSSAPTSDVLDPTVDDVLSGMSLTSTFTYYGSGDGGNTPNCSISPMPCGLLSKPGYTAAVSENLFGSLALGKDSPVCGTCWRLDADVDSSDRLLNKTIVVMVNNICPAQGNPLCSQRTLHDKNEWGAAVDFDLCSDSGAADELFGRGTGVGLAVGRATRVDCKEWSGEIIKP